MQAELSYDQASASFQQTTVGAEKFQYVYHKAGKIRIFGRSRDLRKKLEVMLDNLQRIRPFQVDDRTSSEGSDKVLSRAGKVPLSRDRICRTMSQKNC